MIAHIYIYIYIITNSGLVTLISFLCHWIYPIFINQLSIFIGLLHNKRGQTYWLLIVIGSSKVHGSYLVTFVNMPLYLIVVWSSEAQGIITIMTHA